MTAAGVGVEVSAPNTGVSVTVLPGAILSGIFGLIKGIGNLFTGGNDNDNDTDANGTTAEKSALLPEDDADSDAGLLDVSESSYENDVDITGTVVDLDAADFTLV
ncbi:MAG: hypothetical protein LBF50_01565 [Azoarcus sp.]|nr:hypothetical protein [Azoarcus sp.]